MVVICHLMDKNQQTVLLHLDSLGPDNNCHRGRRIKSTMKKILQHLDPDIEDAHFIAPLLPMQKDAVSCGLFMLTYMTYFIDAAPKTIRVVQGQLVAERIRLGHKNFLSEDWFNENNARGMRRYMR